MTAYIMRRILSVVPILFLVSLIVFGLMRILPGDVATMILLGPEGEGMADPQSLQRLREGLGLDAPLFTQYIDWVTGLLQFDAGESLWSGRPVFEVIAQRAALTVQLALMSAAISIVIALPLGVLSALKQDSWIDYVFRVVSIGGLSLPTFWIANMLIWFLTVRFDWSPPLGYLSPIEDPIANFQILIWPALIRVYSNAAVVSRLTLSTVL